MHVNYDKIASWFRSDESAKMKPDQKEERDAFQQTKQTNPDIS